MVLCCALQDDDGGSQLCQTNCNPGRLSPVDSASIGAADQFLGHATVQTVQFCTSVFVFDTIMWSRSRDKRRSRSNKLTIFC